MKLSCVLGVLNIQHHIVNFTYLLTGYVRLHGNTSTKAIKKGKMFLLRDHSRAVGLIDGPFVKGALQFSSLI